MHILVKYSQTALNIYPSLCQFSRRRIGDNIIFPRKQVLTFYASGDNLHEISGHAYGGKGGGGGGKEGYKKSQCL